MVIRSTKNQSDTKLGNQEQKTRRSHMTADTILLKPALMSGGYSLYCMPDAILQHLLKVDIGVDGNFEPHNREDNPIYISTIAFYL